MRRAFVAGIVTLIVAGLVAAMYQYSTTRPLVVRSAGGSEGTYIQRIISVANKEFVVDIADTPELQQRGLSGRAQLGGDRGMLFVFSSDAYHAFWMKDMRFSIDIIWLTADGRVIAIEKNVSPETYPKSFGPQEPSRYVLELDAGAADILNLAVGDVVQL